MDGVSIAVDKTQHGVDDLMDVSLDRLNSVKTRLSDILWDNDSDELRACLVELDTVIRDHTRFRQDIRRLVRRTA